MCALVLDETGLLPHANSGRADADELALLRDVNVSMGIMLESTSERLLGRGQAHCGQPGQGARRPARDPARGRRAAGSPSPPAS